LVKRWSGSVLNQRHTRSSKFEPLVDEVELIHATPSYAHIRLQNGGKATDLLRDIASVPDDVSFENDEQVILHVDDHGRRNGGQAGPDLAIGYIGLSLEPQDPREPPSNFGTHRLNCRYVISSTIIPQNFML